MMSIDTHVGMAKARAFAALSENGDLSFVDMKADNAEPVGSAERILKLIDGQADLSAPPLAEG